MPVTPRPLLRAAARQIPPWTTSSSHLPLVQRAFLSSTKPPGGTPGDIKNLSEQATPLGPYYEAILIKPQPLPAVKSEEPPTTSTTNKNKNKNKNKTTPEAKEQEKSASAESTASHNAQFTFGSKLGGPQQYAERLAAMKKRNTLIAGILVPPKPEEPDNCCMSGCVNCVWDVFRDDMEQWASASALAEQALQAQRAQGSPAELGKVSAVKGMPGLDGPGAVGVTMDDDGGGFESNWQVPGADKAAPKIAKDFWDEDLYKNVPVGIKEFMKQEKRLKQKHAKENTSEG